MRRRLVAGTGAATALLVLGLVGIAGADPGAATHVDSLSASVSGGSVAVSGSATFVDVPTVVGTDATGDAAVPAPGVDLTSATIARAPGKNTLTFKLGLADTPPSQVGAPLGYLYHWRLTVDGVDEGLGLEAGWGRVCFSPIAGVFFRLVRGGFTVVASLTGSIANNTVTFNDVPMDKLKAKAGSVIGTAAEGVVSTIGVAGCIYFFNQGGDQIDVEEYVVPGESVSLGIAPAGTLPEEVPLTVTATVTPASGAFTGALPKPAAGAYVVVAKACYVADVCDLEATNVTV